MARAGVRCLIVMVMVLIAGRGRAADAPKATPEDIDKKARELVRKLGDPVFRKREAAARDLLELGGLCRAALESSVNDPDAEIRDRCRRLLPLALEAEIRHKLGEFLEDKARTREHDLPGLKRWEAAVGSDAESRAFYAAMVGDNLDLFKNLDAKPEDAAVTQMSRCQDLYTSQFANRMVFNNGGIRQTYTPPAPPTITEFAALLFVGSDDRVDKAIRTGGKMNYTNQIGVLLWQPYVRVYLSTDKDAPVFKKLFIEWLNQLAASEAEEKGKGGAPNVFVNNRISYALTAVQQNDLKEGIGFIEKVLALKELPMYTYSNAITTLGKIGEARHAKLLEPLLTDDRPINPNPINFGAGKPITAEIRDVALGITMHLSGQKPTEYGFDGFKNRNFGFPAGQYYYYQFGFEDDANRGKTFEKWNEFRKKEKLPPIKFELKKEKEEEKKVMPKVAPAIIVRPAAVVPARPAAPVPVPAPAPKKDGN